MAIRIEPINLVLGVEVADVNFAGEFGRFYQATCFTF
jgi:hypothetical protein